MKSSYGTHHMEAGSNKNVLSRSQEKTTAGQEFHTQEIRSSYRNTRG